MYRRHSSSRNVCVFSDRQTAVLAARSLFYAVQGGFAKNIGGAHGRSRTMVGGPRAKRLDKFTPFAQDNKRAFQII